MEHFKIIARFRNRQMTASEYIVFSKKILKELAIFHNVFKQLFGWGHQSDSKRTFNDHWSDFEQIVLEQIDEQELSYLNENALNHNLTNTSTSRSNFLNIYSNVSNIKENQFSISIAAGGEEEEFGNFLIEFPKSNYQGFLDYDFVKALFIKCVELLNPDYAVVISNEFRRKVKNNNTNIWIGWLTYFKGKNFPLAPNGIDYEFINLHSGVLIVLMQNAPLSNNQEAIEKARLLSDVLL